MTTKPSHKRLLQKVQALEKEALARKNAEEQLKKQTEFLNSILESLSHPFYVVDAHDYTIKLANLTAKMSGISGEATCHALIHRRTVPCGSAKHPCPLEIIKRTKKPARVEHIHYDKDGNSRNVEVHAYPIFDEQGNVSQMIEYVLDITERKRIEAALKESETKFRSVAQSANDAIISADKNGNMVFWNMAAQKMFGYREQEIIGRPLTLLMPEGFRDAHLKGMTKHVSTSKSHVIGQTVEMAALTKAGKEFPIELSLSHWKTGADVYYTGIIRDISERQQHEKERDQLIKSLKESLAKVKMLSGLLPICASCKKIRDDKGYWNQIEGYIRQHSEVEFSHGICPECAKRLYPEYFEEESRKSQKSTKN